MKTDRFVDLISKWNEEQKEAERARDTTKFDFLNNPGQLSRLREENRDAAVEEWRNLDLQTQLSSILRQFVSFRGAPSALKGKEEDTSFMLKTKRLEYTFEFFRSQLLMQLDDTSKMTVKDRAD